MAITATWRAVCPRLRSRWKKALREAPLVTWPGAADESTFTSCTNRYDTAWFTMDGELHAADGKQQF
jgi:hypothetical protein